MSGSCRFLPVLISRGLRCNSHTRLLHHCHKSSSRSCLASDCPSDGAVHVKQIAAAHSHCRPAGGTGFRHISDSSSYIRRSHLCGDLSSRDVGESVTLCGWVQFWRQDQFLVLRDWKGVVQLLLSEDKKKQFSQLLSDLRLESVLQVQGTVQRRPQGQENKSMPTGDIEVVVSDLVVLNPCQPKLPFDLKGFHQVKESLRMEHRYLDLRHNRLQRNLRTRSKMVMKMREFLANKHDFVEVETPTLFRRTPGGAKEFVVPSHVPGKFYSLPQSPQQFKQLLMVGGVDRYFQIARCYRDEGAKPDRQPEFTQVDLEMSFVDTDGVISLVEDMLCESLPRERGEVTAPFPRLSYQQCMTQYGCDKPDTRFEWKLQDVSEVFSSHPVPAFSSVGLSASSVQALCIPLGSKHLSNKEIEELTSHGKQNLPDGLRLICSKARADGTFSASLAKHLSQEANQQLIAALNVRGEDLVFLCAGEEFSPHAALSKVRLRAAELIESKGVKVRDLQALNFLWVLDFPLFLPKEDGGEGLESAHHPFTAPFGHDEALVYTQPAQVRGQHYDLVLNGQEIGGGSIRIHNAALQRYVLTHVLQEDCSQLEHLLSALDSGCPPHGGIALGKQLLAQSGLPVQTVFQSVGHFLSLNGLDRLMAIICQTDSIRDVIAFPKSHDGKDPMSKAPATVVQSDLDAYHVVVKRPS